MAVPVNKHGQLIQVTRKCADNIQPAVKNGGLYIILNNEGKTKSGAVRLRVAEMEHAIKMALIKPHAHIPMKETMLINSDRFGWSYKSKSYLLREIERCKTEHMKEQEARQDEEIKAKFSEKERIQLSYTPFLYAELAWHYAHKAVAICVDRRMDEYKKVCRTIKGLRQDFLVELRAKMGQPVLEAAQERVQKALQDYAGDFFKFELSVQNEINFHHVGIKHDDMRTYAYIAMLCYEAQRRVDISNAHLIRRRLGNPTDVVDSYKYMRELYDNIKLCLGGYTMPKSYIVETAVKILEKNIGGLTLN